MGAIELEILNYLKKFDQESNYGALCFALPDYSFDELSTAVAKLVAEGFLVRTLCGFALSEKGLAREGNQEQKHAVCDNNLGDQYFERANNISDASIFDQKEELSSDFVADNSVFLDGEELLGINEPEDMSRYATLGAGELEEMLREVEERRNSLTFGQPGRRNNHCIFHAIEEDPEQMDGAFAASEEDVPLGSKLSVDDNISHLNLPVRVEAACERKNIVTVGNLVKELSNLTNEANVGATSIERTRRILFGHSVLQNFVISNKQYKCLSVESGSAEYIFDMFGFLCKPDKNFIKADETKDSVDSLDAQSGLAKIQETSIDVLSLNEPTARLLHRHRVSTIGDVLRLGEEGLLQLRGLGIGKANEILEAIKAFNPSIVINNNQLSSPDDFEMYVNFKNSFTSEHHMVAEAIYARMKNNGYPIHQPSFDIIVLPQIKTILENLDLSVEECARQVINQFKSDDNLSFVRLSVLASMVGAERAKEDNGEEYFTHNPIPIPDGEEWVQTAHELVENDNLLEIDPIGRCLIIKHLRLLDWLSSLEARDNEVLRGRFNGKTLEEIGNEQGITRERVRQIEAHALRQRPRLEEDKYLYLCSRYQIDLDGFVAITGCAPSVWNYLKIAFSFSRSNRLPLSDALSDESLSSEIANALKRYLDRDYVYADGERIHKDKENITKFLIRKYASDQYITLQHIAKLYESFLLEHKLDSTGRLSITNERAYGAYIERQPFVLNLPNNLERELGGNIRYYDDTSVSFSRLIDYLQQFALEHSVECATHWLYRQEDFQGIAQELDIRNGYELHYLIKHRLPEIIGVTLGRSPGITFGNGNREKQIYDLIDELGPISAIDLSIEYEKRYGVNAATFCGSYLTNFESCCNNGRYTVEHEPLSVIQAEFLQSVLVGDYISYPLIKARFESEFPGASVSLLNKANLSYFGYAPHESLLVKEGLNMRKVFSDLIDSHSQFKIDDIGFGREVFTDSDFKAELSIRINSYSLFEFKKDCYMSTEAFEKLNPPIYQENLKEFVDAVLDFVPDNYPFTVRWLKKQGFENETLSALEDMGFDDYAISSFISTARVGGRIKSTTLKDLPVFAKKRFNFSSIDLFEHILKNEQYIGIDDLCSLLEEEYGLECDEIYARSVARRSQLYFHVGSDTVFYDYETFSRKAQEWIY